MKLIYIAGPYRGPNTWAIEQNIRRAEDAAALVWKAGLAALCPHANSRHMDGVTTDENFLAGTMEMLRRCDAVMVIEGWKNSSGARAEVAEAMRLNKPVLFGFVRDPSGNESVLADLAAGRYLDSVASQNPFEDEYWEGGLAQ